MANETEIDYEYLVQDALRCVIRDVLSQAAKNGLPGDHHFYVAFQTDYPGVDLPDYLREEYPDEITIVVQHEYWDLEVEPDQFAITLCFNDVHERITVPFSAVTSFVDPSVKFGLQFTPVDIEEDRQKAAPKTIKVDKKPSKKAKAVDATPLSEEQPEPKGDGSNIVALDTFRKK